MFFTLLIGIGLLNLFYGDKPISEYENRALEQFPKVSMETFSSGEYFEKINLYFSDQFLCRDKFVQISSVAKDLRGLPGSDGATIVVQSGFNDAVEQASVSYVDESGKGKTHNEGEPNKASTTEKTQDTSILTDNINSEKKIQDTHGAQAASTSHDSVKQGSLDTVPEQEKPSSTQTDQSQAGPSNESNMSKQTDETLEDLPQLPSGEAQAIAEQASIPENTDATVGEEKKDDGQRIGRILIYKNSAMQLFKANGVAEQYYANTLNTFKQRAGEQIKTYSLLAPTNIEFIDNKKYKDLSDSQKDAIARVNKKFEDIEIVNAYEKLDLHKDEYVYFRTDHHWTALGAYYAYTAFAGCAGFDAVPLEKYETEIIEDYVGSMYDMTSSSTLKKHPDIITVYKPYVENEYNVWYEGPVKLKVIDMYHANEKNKYRVFISGDRPLGIVKTEVKNGKKILVIKDSYGNAMIPLLLPHYEEIYVVDPRQYDKNIFKLIDDNKIQEVLFLNYALILGDNSFSDLIVKVMEL